MCQLNFIIVAISFLDILKNFANERSRSAAGKSETSTILLLFIEDKYRWNVFISLACFLSFVFSLFYESSSISSWLALFPSPSCALTRSSESSRYYYCDYFDLTVVWFIKNWNHLLETFLSFLLQMWSREVASMRTSLSLAVLCLLMTVYWRPLNSVIKHVMAYNSYR